MVIPGDSGAASRWFQIVVLSCAILVTIVLSWELWGQTTRKLEELSSSRVDNVVWTFGQLEVDFQRLDFSLSNLVLDPENQSENLRDARRRFDAYYSRVELLRVSAAYRQAVTEIGRVEILDQLSKQNKKLAKILDGPDDQVIAQAASLLAELESSGRAIRDLAIRGNIYTAESAQAARNDVVKIMRWLSLATLALTLFLALLAALFYRSSLRNRNRAVAHEATSVHLAEMLATSPDALVVTEGNGRITEFNQAAEDLFQISKEEVTGRRLNRFLQTEIGAMATLPFVKKGRVSERQMVLKTAREIVLPVEVSQGVARSGKREFYIYFLRDVSERRSAERSLQLSRDKALEAERAKSRFMAVMSHEMRTPLNGILGIVELMQDDRQTAEERSNYMDMLENSGRILLNHVNDVLEIAELEADGLKLTKRSFSLDEMLDRVGAALSIAAQRKGNEITFEKSAEQLGQYWGDEQRLSQVMTNLISNANKFTNQGHITVSVSAHPTKGGTASKLEIQVCDTGIGIAEEDQDKIFEDFVRIREQNHAQVEGTGLGLGIVKRIVEAMGGEIGLDSLPGEGSVFWVTLTLPRASASSREGRLAEPQKSVAPLSILLVDDNATNRFVARQMLLRDGHQVAEAVNGKMAVEMASEQTYDVILMDISMPVMGGIEATQHIRRSGACQQSRIVAVTAHVYDQDTTLYGEAGMDGVVSKPITRRNLRAMLTGEGRLHDERSEEVLLNIDHLTQMTQNLGQARCDQVIAGFAADLPQLVNKLKTGNGADPEALSREVHSLAGAAAMIGAGHLRTTLNRLEAKLISGDAQDPAGWGNLVENIWQETQAEIAAQKAAQKAAGRAEPETSGRTEG